MNALMMLLESAGADGGAIERLLNLPDAASQLADKDYWSSVGILALTGILVVFLILAILIFFFWLMGTIFKAINRSHAENKASKDAAKTEKPAAPVAVQAEAAVDDEEEIIAVISAAIAAYEGDGNFTIRNVVKHGGRSAWSMAGLSDNMRQF